MRGLDHTTAKLMRGLQAVLEQLTPSQMSRLGPLLPGRAQQLVSDNRDAKPSISAPSGSSGAAAAAAGDDRRGSSSEGSSTAAGKDTGSGGGCIGAKNMASDVHDHDPTVVSASASMLTDMDPSSTLQGHASSWALRLPPRDFVPTGDGEEGTGEEEAEDVYESGGGVAVDGAFLRLLLKMCSQDGTVMEGLASGLGCSLQGLLTGLEEGLPPL